MAKPSSQKKLRHMRVVNIKKSMRKEMSNLIDEKKKHFLQSDTKTQLNILLGQNHSQDKDQDQKSQSYKDDELSQVSQSQMSIRMTDKAKI